MMWFIITHQSTAAPTKKTIRHYCSYEIVLDSIYVVHRTYLFNLHLNYEDYQDIVQGNWTWNWFFAQFFLVFICSNLLSECRPFALIVITNNF